VVLDGNHRFEFDCSAVDRCLISHCGEINPMTLDGIHRGDTPSAIVLTIEYASAGSPDAVDSWPTQRTVARPVITRRDDARRAISAGSMVFAR